MTDSLDVLKDKSHSCALVYPTKKEFSLVACSKRTPSWLRRSLICSPPPAALFPDPTAGTRMESRTRQGLKVIFYTKAFTPNIRIERQARLLLKYINHSQIIDKLVSNKKPLPTKLKMKIFQDVIETVSKTLKSRIESIANSQSIPKTLPTEKFCCRTKKKFPPGVLIPLHRTLCHYHYHPFKGTNLFNIVELKQPGCFGLVLLNNCLKSFRNLIKEGIVPMEITVYHNTPRNSISCGPVLRSVDLRKPLEHLSAEDLQEIAGGDDSVEQENVTDYCYGGYKPIEIGEEIAHRYTVIRKLGFGHFSTVWLCKDRQDPTSIQYVAVKIVKAAEMFNCVAQDEIKLLRCIMNGDPNHPGRNHVIQMLDYFQTRSINGHHTCISFELMGPSLLHLLVQSDYRGIHISGVRNIIKQVLKGLSYLHDICKIIHTDIKPENILIKVKDSYVRNLVDTSSRYNELGIQMPRTYVSAETWENYLYIRDPVDLNIKAGPSKENDNLSRSSSFPKDEDDKRTTPERHNAIKKLKQPLYISPNIEVKIADLGNACWEDRHFSPNIQTKQYRALEVILGADYSTPADIWSVGCMAFELATAEYLFNPKRSQYLTSAEDHILLICELLGSIPNYIAQRGTAAHNYFDAGGNLKIYADHQLHLRIWKTEDVLVEKYKWKRVDAIPFATLIESMIEPDPELRVTATMALQSEWFNEG